MYSGIVAGDASVCACQLLAILVVSYLHKKKKKKENGRESLKLVSNITLKKWKMNFRLEHSNLKSRSTFSDVPLRLESFY